MSSAQVSLQIDMKGAVEKIRNYLRDLVGERSAKGVVLGLSGGLDSAVLVALAVRALGKDRVHVFYLYDRDSEEDSKRKALLVANWLGLELRIEDIEPVMRERGVYNAFAMRASAFSRAVNRLIIASYGRAFSETGFLSTLRHDASEGRSFRKRVYEMTIGRIEDSFNARHRYRREVLEKKAKEQNWILLGAANRSECMVGWFVKDGIDDLPLSPLMALYKTQVRQLAVHLDLPEEIREQVPSPDMLRGITDEFAMDIRYDRLDIILDGIDRGISDEDILEWGMTRREISLVREMHRLSAWKRESPHEEPPVDGGVNGGLRIEGVPSSE